MGSFPYPWIWLALVTFLNIKVSRRDIQGLAMLKHKEPCSSFLEHSFLDPVPFCKKFNFHDGATMRPPGGGQVWLTQPSSQPGHSAGWEWGSLRPYKPTQPPVEYHQVIPADTLWNQRATQSSPPQISDPQNCETLIKWLLVVCDEAITNQSRCDMKLPRRAPPMVGTNLYAAGLCSAVFLSGNKSTALGCGWQSCWLSHALAEMRSVIVA